MSFNLATTELSSVFLDPSDALGQDAMNYRFKDLLDNDIIINERFANSIGVWQCYWYYDSSIKGYSIGDAVWINTEDSFEFLKSHAATIKEYTDLNSQILTKLPDFNEFDDEVISKYINALTGYADPSLGKNAVLQPIYDIGDFSKPIQLAVSLKNNNKSPLSDRSAWKTLFVDSEEDSERIRKIIDAQESDTIVKHFLNFHLSGCESEVENTLSSYVDEISSSIDYNTLPSSWYSVYDKNSSPSFGIDYVTYFIRKPILLSGAVSQYQAVRYWKSGLMEHFGTIATDNPEFLDDSGRELVVPFDWQIANDGTGAKAYKRGELAKTLDFLLSALETDDSLIPPKDNMINVVFEDRNVKVDGLSHVRHFANTNYNVSVNAVYQTQSGIEDRYIPVSYGVESFSQKWNSNYLSNAILGRKSKRSFSMRKDTRVVAPYISYYAIGKGQF